MDVLAIDRRHEASIDARANIVCQHISFVLDCFDRRDIVIELVGLREQKREESRRFLQSLGEFVEQNEEAFVAWDETHGVSSGVAETTRRLLLSRGAAFVTEPRQR